MNEVRFFSFAIGANMNGVDVQAIVDLHKDGFELDNGFLFVVCLPASEALQRPQSSVIHDYSHTLLEQHSSCRINP